MRPVLRGLCDYKAIMDPDLDLADFVLMNEAIDVEIENQCRIRAANEKRK